MPGAFNLPYNELLDPATGTMIEERRTDIVYGWNNDTESMKLVFEFKRLVEANMDALAHMLSSEHGKVIADSKGDIQRGLEVIEFCCGIPPIPSP